MPDLTKITELTYKLAKAKLNRMDGVLVEKYEDDILQDVVLQAIEEAQKERWESKPDAEVFHYLKAAVPLNTLKAYQKYVKYDYGFDSLDDQAYDEDGEGTTMGDLVEDDTCVETYLDTVDELQDMESRIGWRDMEVLRMYHDYGYTAAEIIEQRPDLEIGSTKTINRIIGKHSK